VLSDESSTCFKNGKCPVTIPALMIDNVMEFEVVGVGSRKYWIIAIGHIDLLCFLFSQLTYTTVVE
jgi:hypothetical protein